MADLRISGLRKTYDQETILRGIDLDVSSGELLAVLGASGSGKTTLLRLVGGFERADAGEIAIDGQVVAERGVHVPPEARGIGFVPQEGALFPHLSVADNVVFGLERPERRDRPLAQRLLEGVGLPASYASRAPHELSGGEQQRVALARALAPRPRLVLLDEPFSALDTALRIETRKVVVAVLGAARATALLVTHDQSEALSLGHRVAVLRSGALAQVATPEELYRRPRDKELAQFVGEAVLLPGDVAGNAATCALGLLPLARAIADGPVDVMIRPEQIRVVAAREAPLARIAAVTFFGHDASVEALLASDGQKVTLRVAGHLAPKIGMDVRLSVDGSVMAYPRAQRDRRAENSLIGASDRRDLVDPANRPSHGPELHPPNGMATLPRAHSSKHHDYTR
jgi:iron(III) transport system ATP-binding protein